MISEHPELWSGRTAAGNTNVQMSVAKIVILNWNGAEHLRRFLPNVVAAAPAGVEVVVADNGSTDDSLRGAGDGIPSVGVLRLDANTGLPEGITGLWSRSGRTITCCSIPT